MSAELLSVEIGFFMNIRERYGYTSVEAVVCKYMNTKGISGRLAEALHQVRRKRDKPCRGKVNCRRVSPCSIGIQAGDVRSCNCPAPCNCSYCAGEGDCGDPICFQAVKALL